RCYADILPAAKAGALFIDSSTISVNDAREVHALAESHGVAQLDAPVSGGVKGAVAGTLAFMVGGDESALQRARPVLEPMAGKVLGLAMDAVASTGSAAPLGAHAAEIYAKFAASHADKDFSAVIEMLRSG